MIASPQAVDYLLDVIQSPNEDPRGAAIDALGSQGGRWAVPVLIDLLDDPTLRTSHKGEPFPIAAFDGIWPDGHRAHMALFNCLYRAGLEGNSINLATGERNDVNEEIKRLKAWWKEHGEDFLQGRPVPNPNITTVVCISN